MKPSFYSILKSKKFLFFGRIAFGLTICITIVLFFRIYHIIPKFKLTNDLLKEYYNLKREMADLSAPTSISIQNSDSLLKYRGVLNGWTDAAALVEKIRTNAINQGIEFRYTIDSLITESAVVNNLYRIPINITAFPTNGRFETVLQFFQNTVSDTSLYLSLENMVVTGDDVGLTSANIILYGWIQL